MSIIPSGLFLGYVAAVAASVVVLFFRYLPLRSASVGAAILVGWLAYAGSLGYLGIARNSNLVPPGIVFLVAPPILIVALIVVKSPAGAKLAVGIPLAILLGFQSFRVGVELALFGLWQHGLVPRLLTLEGGNVEIVVGLTAPLAAWLSTRGHIGRRVALGWNLAGLLSLLNIAARAVLTSPGPLNLIHAEVPNLAMGIFPFSFIPGFLAPLAVMLHILAFRAMQITADRRTEPAGPRHCLVDNTSSNL